MREYLVTVLSASLLFALLSHVAYRKGDRCLTLALSIVALSAMILPLGSLLKSLSDLDTEIPAIKFDGEREYERCAEEAYCKAVADALAEEFKLDGDNLRVFCVGFDIERVRCECITVRLVGGAVFSDFDEMKKYLAQSLGGVDVEIVIG